MTYFHRRGAYYHWRGSVSPSCSGWEGVVPLCYGRQTKGWGRRFFLDPAFGLSGELFVQASGMTRQPAWKKVLG